MFMQWLNALNQMHEISMKPISGCQTFQTSIQLTTQSGSNWCLTRKSETSGIWRSVTQLCSAFSDAWCLKF